MIEQEVTVVKCDKSPCEEQHYLFLVSEIQRRMRLIRDSLIDTDMEGIIPTKDTKDEVRVM